MNRLVLIVGIYGIQARDGMNTTIIVGMRQKIMRKLRSSVLNAIA